MSEKPSYLGLLNAIAVAESQAYRYLTAWIKATKSPEVRAVLLTVAAREGEHGMSFAKRVNQLGYEVRPRDDLGVDERMEIAGSDMSDLEKMERFGLHRLDEVLCAFDDVFKDHTIDIETGELLGRYIAEEFDTSRLLRCCYDQLRARAERERTGPTSADLRTLNDKVDALCRSVEELRQIVCAQSMPAEAS
jgi:rubrerythrin